MNKKIINKDFILMIGAIFLLILGGFLVFWFSSSDFRLKTQSPKIIGQAALTIDFGNGEKRVFEGDIVENETLANALVQASKAGDFSYKLDQKNNLAAVERFTNDGKKSWHWYLNGKKIDKSLNETIIEDGDNILIKYE